MPPIRLLTPRPHHRAQEPAVLFLITPPLKLGSVRYLPIPNHARRAPMHRLQGTHHVTIISNTVGHTCGVERAGQGLQAHDTEGRTVSAYGTEDLQEGPVFIS